MTEDSFNSQPRIGQSILHRNGCTESDVAYHLVARLLECSGWAPVELYFERWGNGSAPDITLIPQGQSLPVLTVEVKQTWDGGGCEAGWARTFARDQTRRADPLLQVYQQLDRIERLHAHRFALLIDGRRFGSFAVVPERPDTIHSQWEKHWGNLDECLGSDHAARAVWKSALAFSPDQDDDEGKTGPEPQDLPRGDGGKTPRSGGRSQAVAGTRPHGKVIQEPFPLRSGVGRMIR